MKKLLTISIIILVLMIIGLFMYDSLVFRPSAKVTLGELPDVKKGNQFTTVVTLLNQSKSDKEFSLTISVNDPDGKALFSADKKITVKKQENYEYDLKADIPEAGQIGTYLVAASAQTRRTIFSLETPVIAEVKNSFSVVEKVRKAEVTAITVTAPSMKVGNTFTMNVKIKNTGEAEHEFQTYSKIVKPSGEAVEFPLKTIKLSIGAAGLITNTLEILVTGEPGRYSAYAAVGTALDQDGKVGGTKADLTKEFEVAPPVVSGKMSLSSDSSTKNFGDTVKFKAVFTNDGEIKTEYSGKITLLGPDGKESSLFDEKLELKAGEETVKTPEFKLSNDLPDGEYKVKGEFLKSTGEKCGEGTTSFSLVDKAPSVVMYVGVPPANVGEGGQLTVVVRDDKKIDKVTLQYMGPGEASFTVVDMAKTDGDEKQATYQAKVPAFDKKGTLKYQVEVTDSKGQSTKSALGTIELKEKEAVKEEKK